MVTLTLDGVCGGYGRERIVHEVSTPRIEGSQLVAVIGPNAAGKSTLFRRIAGLITGPGEVRIDGSLKGPRGIAYMPQDISATARLTVYESILLARKQADPGWRVGDDDLAAVDRILAALDIHPLAFRTLAALSGGQRQLASLAQTLATEPEIMLMDEPTSALDLHRQLSVLGFLRTLATSSGVLILIAMHDLNQALRFTDQTLVMARGHAVAFGKSHDVINAALLEQVYQVRARIEPCSRGEPQIIVDGVS